MVARRLASSVLVALLFALGGQAGSAEPVALTAGSVAGAVGATATIPIMLKCRQDLGSLQLDLVYDRSLLEIRDVRAGSLMGGALLVHNVTTPGRLRIAFTGDPRHPVKGEGELLRVDVSALGRSGDCALVLERVRAWDGSEQSFEMRVDPTSGRFTVSAPPSTELPTLVVLAGVVLLVLWFMLRRKAAAEGVAGTSPAARDPRFCRGCGASLNPEGKFCAACGQKA